MNKYRANKIIKTFEDNYCLDKKFIHNYVEALKFLLTKGDLNAMLTYGQVMEHFGRYELAEKIYNGLIKLSTNNRKMLKQSLIALGWINLRINKNLSLAYYNFMEAARYGDISSKYFIALMYKNGVFVNKNYERYKDIILNHCSDQYTDIVPIEKVKIYKREFNIDKCIETIENTGLTCSPTLICGYSYFAGADGIKEILKIKELANEYNLIKDEDIELYNLPIYFEKTNIVTFYYCENEYIIENKVYNGAKYFSFQNKNYRSFAEMLVRAEIKNKPLFTLNEEICKFVINGKQMQRIDN